MNSFIPVIEEIFGERLSPDIIPLVEQANDDQLHELSVRYKEYGDHWIEPPRGDGELRPYLPITYTGYADWVTSGIPLSAYSFKSIENVWEAIDNLKHRLFYCHSIAIDDPGSHIIDIIKIYAGNDNFKDQLQDQKRQLINYLSFLIEIKSLVESGVVTLIPEKYASSRGYFKSDRDERLEANLDLSDCQEFIERRTKRSIDKLTRTVLVRSAERTLLDIAATNEKLKEGVHFYLPYAFWETVLEDLFKESSQFTNVSMDELRLLQSLIQVPLPGLDRLSVTDIVKVREDDSFKSWRIALRKGLRELRTADKSDLLSEKEKLTLLQEESYERTIKLQEEIEKSAFLKNLRKHTIDFKVGLLAMLVGLPLGGKISLAVGATLAARTLFNLIRKQAEAKPKESLLNHYVAFYPKGKV